MQKTVISLGAVVAIGLGIWFAVSSAQGVPEVSSQPTTTPTAWECNGDAKICPDGSAVGRTGPKCEFVECPSIDRTEATLTTHIGGSPTAMNITVNPKKVVSDSRCAEGVQCIWAGTVEVRTVISSKVAHGEHVLTLGKPQTFGDYTVTLTEVTPYPQANTPIPESSYRFTFDIKKQ